MAESIANYSLTDALPPMQTIDNELSATIRLDLQAFVAMKKPSDFHWAFCHFLSLFKVLPPYLLGL
jgi:hypothetical protein